MVNRYKNFESIELQGNHERYLFAEILYSEQEANRLLVATSDVLRIVRASVDRLDSSAWAGSESDIANAMRKCRDRETLTASDFRILYRSVFGEEYTSGVKEEK